MNRQFLASWCTRLRSMRCLDASKKRPPNQRSCRRYTRFLTPMRVESRRLGTRSISTAQWLAPVDVSCASVERPLRSARYDGCGSRIAGGINGGVGQELTYSQVAESGRPARSPLAFVCRNQRNVALPLSLRLLG